MIEGRGSDTDRESLYNHWDKLTEWQRDIFFALFWLEMQKRNKLFWLFLVTAFASVIAWGVWHDPIVLAIGILVGLVLGVIVSPLR